MIRLHGKGTLISGLPPSVMQYPIEMPPTIAVVNNTIDIDDSHFTTTTW
jgi:hypothetical protein